MEQYKNNKAQKTKSAGASRRSSSLMELHNLPLALVTYAATIWAAWLKVASAIGAKTAQAAIRAKNLVMAGSLGLDWA